jgi:hypothetical protein
MVDLNLWECANQPTYFPQLIGRLIPDSKQRQRFRSSSASKSNPYTILSAAPINTPQRSALMIGARRASEDGPP